MKLDLVADHRKESAHARAALEGRDGKITGTAKFTEYTVDDFPYVIVELELQGDPELLTPGRHAVHIHEKADCGEDFKCAGGHFDPGPSGNGDPDTNHPFHAGDLPNITIDEEGHGHLMALTSRITLSAGPRSILDVDGGTSLMIHANPDPYKGGESGSGVSGGPRIACGVITKS